MLSKATTVEQYLAELPEDGARPSRPCAASSWRTSTKTTRRDAIRHDRLLCATSRLSGRLPLRSQAAAPVREPCITKKPHGSLSHVYLCRYTLASWFREAWAKTGKKLDMGKACVRTKKVDDLALDVIGEAIRRVPARTYIEHCEAATKGTSKQSRKQQGKRTSAATSADGEKNAVAAPKIKARER